MRHLLNPTILLLSAGLAQASPAAAIQSSPHAGMTRHPAVSETHIVFSYADDLWTVPRSGGVASPLVSPPGRESSPRFSADGKTIAFVGNYDGDTDLYTVPTVGGIPHRVTYHPQNEELCGYTPKGDLLFQSNGIPGFVDKSGCSPYRREAVFRRACRFRTARTGRLAAMEECWPTRRMTASVALGSATPEASPVRFG
jgi:hypothetical protein